MVCRCESSDIKFRTELQSQFVAVPFYFARFLFCSVINFNKNSRCFVQHFPALQDVCSTGPMPNGSRLVPNTFQIGYEISVESTMQSPIHASHMMLCDSRDGEILINTSKVILEARISNLDG